jgi:carboxypeptidase Q
MAKKYSIVFIFILCNVFHTSLQAQEADTSFIQKIATSVLTKGAAYENLRHLSKKIGQRLSGNAAMYKAEDWAAALLKSYGADTVIKQACKIPNWKRGAKETCTIYYKGKAAKLNVTALGNSIGGKAIGKKIIMLNNETDIAKNEKSIKGNIVFLTKRFEDSLVSTFEAYGKTGGIRRAGTQLAAQYGAAGLMIRSLSHSAADNHPHTGSTQTDSAKTPLPAVALGLRDADMLEQLLHNGTTITASLQTNCFFRPDTIAHNIIGVIYGKENPNQIITVGGHLDSWDLGEGAHDDGAGVVHSIEVLRQFKQLGYAPKNTIHIVLFANEENGLRGGQAYADNFNSITNANAKPVFALESDAGGFTPRSIGVLLNDMQLYAHYKNLSGYLKKYGVYDINANGGGADIGPLRRKFGTILSGFQPDGQRYFDVHHAASDVFENVHKRELLLGALNITAFIYLVDFYSKF